MAESNKKRSGSFKKFFPSLFFNKSKDKNKGTSLKDTHDVTKNNTYHDPPSVIRSDKYENPDNERIYENLTANRKYDSDLQSGDILSDRSSSSTLVSVHTKNRHQQSYETHIRSQKHSARPQVPPKPHCEMHTTNHGNTNSVHYPDVYYHSLEKLTDKISPMDEIEIYRASQAQADPASVGAEIKRVSTKFLISPKKEAQVRTLQPTRARSLSFDRSKDSEERSHTNPSPKKSVIKKAYNYSAPTSPIPINHRIPSMPKTASPYEHVRKHMIETEEKRNSLARSSLRKTTPSPGQENFQKHSISSHSAINDEISRDKEKTRQKVEAFYWTKLKEMKEKEDEYFLRQASLRSPIHMHNPTSLRVEPRSSSLPRGAEMMTYTNQPLYSLPFIRGAQERRTDTFVKSRATVGEPEIVYRHPEKMFVNSPQPMQKAAIFNRGSLNRQSNIESQPKRVSFEEQYSKPENTTKSVVPTKVTNNVYKQVNPVNECSINKKLSDMSRGPPRPPVRTTSVGVKRMVNNSRIIHLAGASGYSVYSGSESGSEAGEIQRILQSNARKGK